MDQFIITDDAEEAVTLLPGEQAKIINRDGLDIGSFTLQGISPIPASDGRIVLAGVPDDGHRVYIDVNHHASYQFLIKNDGDPNRAFNGYWEDGDEAHFHGPYSNHDGKAHISSSQPVTLVWDTEAREDLDVRVTVKITPLAEEHAIIISHTVVPLAEARENDRVARLTPIQRWFEARKK